MKSTLRKTPLSKSPYKGDYTIGQAIGGALVVLGIIVISLLLWILAINGAVWLWNALR